MNTEIKRELRHGILEWVTSAARISLANVHPEFKAAFLACVEEHKLPRLANFVVLDESPNALSMYFLSGHNGNDEIWYEVKVFFPVVRVDYQL